jgi:low temperature requirement protein LtrA
VGSVTEGAGLGRLLPPAGGGQRVTFMELFFDLVYVVAVTQLSQLLLAQLSAHGAAQTALLLVAVWSAWIYNAWLTSWFDPDRQLVRLALLVVMLASLVMSATLPEAFGERGLLFAGAYLAIQGGRSVFAVAVLRAEPRLRRDVQRIQSWLVVSAMLWLAGGLAHGTAREVLWLAAVVVDLGAPACRFFVPRLGRSQTTDWMVTGAHLAERFQLFVMIALGESILVTGVTFGQLPWSPATLAALVAAFVGSAALWWIYFNRSAEDGRAVIARSTDPGRLGRVAYTYFHLPMVAGIIVTAVGDDLTVTNPGGDADAATIATVLGGPALFLAGHVLFKRQLLGVLSVARLVAIAALVALVPLGWVVSPLGLATLATLVLAAVAGWDSRTQQARLPVPPTA